MLIADVNIYLQAHRDDEAFTGAIRPWLLRQLDGDEPFGVSPLVLSAFVRIVTNHRVYSDPTPREDALAFCADVRSAQAALDVMPGERHWSIFAELVRRTRARANIVPDAYLAALAIENGATFVTLDRGFARFPGLRLLDPLNG